MNCAVCCDDSFTIDRLSQVVDAESVGEPERSARFCALGVQISAENLYPSVLGIRAYAVDSLSIVHTLSMCNPHYPYNCYCVQIRLLQVLRSQLTFYHFLVLQQCAMSCRFRAQGRSLSSCRRCCCAGYPPSSSLRLLAYFFSACDMFCYLPW